MCWVSNQLPIGHEPSALTTRPAVTKLVPAGIFMTAETFSNASHIFGLSVFWTSLDFNSQKDHKIVRSYPGVTEFR